MSSLLFHIETGRCLNLPVHERICRCCTDLENAQLQAVLPIPEVYIENEEHIISSCLRYNTLSLSLMMQWDNHEKEFSDIHELGLKLVACFAKSEAKILIKGQLNKLCS